MWRCRKHLSQGQWKWAGGAWRGGAGFGGWRMGRKGVFSFWWQFSYFCWHVSIFTTTTTTTTTSEKLWKTPEVRGFSGAICRYCMKLVRQLLQWTIEASLIRSLKYFSFIFNSLFSPKFCTVRLSWAEDKMGWYFGMTHAPGAVSITRLVMRV